MNITREEKQFLRSILFKHQDGIAIINIVAALEQTNILSFLEKEKETTLDKIIAFSPKFHKGYLNVALRSLSSQGLVTYTVLSDDVAIAITPKFKFFKKHYGLYISFSEIYAIQLTLLKTAFSNKISIDNRLIEFSKKLKQFKESNIDDRYFQEEVLIHLEGLLLMPVLVYLTFSAEANNIRVEELVYGNKELELLLENLSLLQDRKFTKKGQFLVEKSYAYGVTTSYLPILANVELYLYGDFNRFFERDNNGNEQHVFRTLNVWGSGGSHKTYFKKIDTVLTAIFNKPIEQQPKGIIDVGCGNGALLEHVFNLIWNDTNRREDLHKNKLILIGADYNKEALLSTQQNLKKADVWAEVVWGDIGNPKEMDKKLQELYNVKLSELLNIRSFLDHNRPFNPPKEKATFSHISTGAFAARGKFLHNIDVEQSLVEHLKKWKPYVKKYGLLLIELHTLQPEVVSVNLGKTPCTAYDITHGFSDQYIVEIEVFNKAVKRAGLTIDTEHYYKFPDSKLSTVSINLIS